MNIFNTSLEDAIKVSLFYKDQQGRLRKKTNDYSELKAAFTNQLYVDGGVVRERKKDISDNKYKNRLLQRTLPYLELTLPYLELISIILINKSINCCKYDY